MNNHGMNPYLPSWEYVPDGEPHVFGNRVYVYGSHDRFNGYAFCLNDYVCWSARMGGTICTTALTASMSPRLPSAIVRQGRFITMAMFTTRTAPSTARLPVTDTSSTPAC